MTIPILTPINKPNRQRIFSPINLIILLCILAIGIYVLFLDPNTGIYVGNTKDEAKIFATQEIDTPLLEYKAATGDFPTTQQGLQALITPPLGVTDWRGPYLNKSTFPFDPWKHPYHYAYPSTHGQPVGKYDCWSIGPDGIDATKDDIGNWQN